MAVTLVSAADLNSFFDNQISLYLRALGNSTAAYGIGLTGDTFGAADQATDAKALIASMSSVDFIGRVGNALRTQPDQVDAVKMVAGILRGSFRAANAHAKDAGYGDLDDVLSYYNTGAGGDFTATQDYRLRDLWYRIFGEYPSPHNLYQEILQGSTYANGLRKHVVGTGNTAGVDIDHTKYSGGVPKLKVASGISGSGEVTVTGIGFDPNTGTITSSVTWTVTASANTTYAFTGGTAPTGSHIVSVSSIAAAGGIAAGTMYVEAHVPSGRSQLPLS